MRKSRNKGVYRYRLNIWSVRFRRLEKRRGRWTGFIDNRLFSQLFSDAMTTGLGIMQVGCIGRVERIRIIDPSQFFRQPGQQARFISIPSVFDEHPTIFHCSST